MNFPPGSGRLFPERVQSAGALPAWLPGDDAAEAIPGFGFFTVPR